MVKAPKQPTKVVAFKVPADLLARFDAHQVAKRPKLAWMRFSRALWFIQAMERELSAALAAGSPPSPVASPAPPAPEPQTCRRSGCGAQFPARPGPPPKVYCSVSCRARDSEVRTGKRCNECGEPRRSLGVQPEDLELLRGMLEDMRRVLDSTDPDLQQCRDLLALSALVLQPTQ